MSLGLKLIEQKAKISLVTSQDYLFCIGGFNSNYALLSCDYLKDNANKWVKFSSLNQPNCCITSLFIESSHYIYVFGGALKVEFEKIFTGNLYGSTKWNQVHLNTMNYNYFRSYGVSFQINKSQILLFGGKSSNPEMMIFDLVSNKIFSTSKFSKMIPYNTSKVCLKGNHIYVVSSKYKIESMIDLKTFDYFENSHSLDF